MTDHHLFKHGHRPKSGGSSTYRSWISMRSRCSDSKNKNYHGKGIEVCERWNEFSNFLADMGERPKGSTIDRIDPSKGYSPENCRLASSKLQSRNKSTSVIVCIGGERVNLVDLAERSGIPKTTLYRRYNQGLRGDDLLVRANLNKGKERGKKLPDYKIEMAVKMVLVDNVSQAKVAKMFGVSQSTICFYVKRHARYSSGKSYAQG